MEYALALEVTSDAEPALLVGVDSGHADPTERSRSCTVHRWRPADAAFAPTTESCEAAGPGEGLYPE